MDLAEGGPAAGPAPPGTTKGIRRVLLVAALGAAAFGAAIVTLADDGRRGCVAEAQPDPAYRAQLVGDAELERREYDIEVTRGGRPVVGARVCASVSMVGMSAMGVSDTAVEVRPGVYRVALVLEMAGGWRGSILVTESGKPPVSVPLRFQVS